MSAGDNRVDAINVIVDDCHTASRNAGWWEGVDIHGDPHVVPAKLCLIHSEISEAMEGHRKSLPDSHLPHRPMVEVELADALIRIFDLAGALGLDLFCCQGGASMGYHRAGFDVVGVDLAPQPRYPFEFHQGDALEFLAEHAHEFDAIHASPPCHDHSDLSALVGQDGTGDLLTDTLAALDAIDRPWIVENVEGAPMPGALVLCGTEFGLTTVTRDGRRRWLRRHRLFASSEPLWGAGGCWCSTRPVIGVYGTGGGGQMTRGYKAYPGEDAAVMGADWMDRHGLSQGIPPAYTEFLGGQLLAVLEVAA